MHVEIADVFFFLGSILMSLMIIVLLVVLFMLFYLKKKASDITRTFQRELKGGIVPWLVSMVTRRRN